MAVSRTHEFREEPGLVVQLDIFCSQLGIAEHAHDWPSVIFPLLGGFEGADECGTSEVAGPSAYFHPASSAHAARINDAGLDSLIVYFDPACLPGVVQVDRPRLWREGCGGGHAKRVMHAILRQEMAVSLALQQLLGVEIEQRAAPAWFQRARAMIDADANVTTRAVAERLGMSPSWLAQAYRAFAGEGLREAIARRRVEEAARLLRTTPMPLPEVAAAAGFCDQSHMNRCFRTLLNRTPLAIRQDAA